MILGVGGGRIQNGRVCRNTDAAWKTVKPVDVSSSTGVSDTSVARIGPGFLILGLPMTGVPSTGGPQTCAAVAHFGVAVRWGCAWWGGGDPIADTPGTLHPF